MGENTGIPWCDHTFNGWIGCTMISPGCANCYAKRENDRYNWNPAGWGPNAPRKLTSDANWNKPLLWDKAAAEAGVIRRVFCSSLADVFDPEVPRSWRERLWHLISTTPHLEWLLLTKRPENIRDMVPIVWLDNPPDNVRLMVTAENQEMAKKRISYLLYLWHGKNGISVEPMLEEVNLSYYLPRNLPRIDWVICGGESGPKARPLHPDWVRLLRDQCSASQVPFLFKQWGEWVLKKQVPIAGIDVVGKELTFERIGKAAAGHLLDGKEYMEFPTVGGTNE